MLHDNSQAKMSRMFFPRVGNVTCCINPNDSKTPPNPESTETSVPGALASPQTSSLSVVDESKSDRRSEKDTIMDRLSGMNVAVR